MTKLSGLVEYSCQWANEQIHVGNLHTVVTDISKWTYCTKPSLRRSPAQLEKLHSPRTSEQPTLHSVVHLVNIIWSKKQARKRGRRSNRKGNKWTLEREQGYSKEDIGQNETKYRYVSTDKEKEIKYGSSGDLQSAVYPLSAIRAWWNIEILNQIFCMANRLSSV